MNAIHFVGLAAVTLATFASPNYSMPQLMEPMILAKTEPAQQLVAASAAKSTLSLCAGATNITVPVGVVALRHEFKGQYGGNSNWTLHLVEFQIKSDAGQPFAWHCWEGAENHPHDLKLFTTQSKSYACYTSSQGVNIFSVNQSVDSDVARGLLLQSEKRPGQITTLSNAMLQRSVGAGPFLGMNALYWAINIDSVSEVNGELQIALHGEKVEPQYTFALRGNAWVLAAGRER